MLTRFEVILLAITAVTLIITGINVYLLLDGVR